MINWFFIGVALFIVTKLIIGARNKMLRVDALQRNGIRTQGIVLKNRLMLGRISVVRPVIQFTTLAGAVIEATDVNGTAMIIPKFAKGQRVTLFYQEDNPSNFTITSNGRYS